MNYGKKGVLNRQRYINPIAGKFGKKAFLLGVKILLVCFLLVSVAGTCAGIGMVKGVIDTAPEVSLIDVSPTGYKTTVYDCNGEVIQELIGASANRIYVTIDKIPLDLQHAFVAIEDERFYTHNGIDPKGILRAAKIAIQSRSLEQGASTITQQLLKNNVFNAFNESTSEKIKRKIQEQYLALKLEEQLDKDTILENYLNTINLGNGNLGVQAAAQNYFDKDVSELTVSECAVIAAITQYPEGYNPVRFPENNAKRRKTVLEKMKNQGYISQEQYDEAMADYVYARIQNIQSYADNTTTYSYFVDELIKQVKNDLIEQKGYTETQANNLIYKGGLKIISTQNSRIQAIVDEEFQNPENFPDSTKVSIEYSLVVKELDGKVYNYTENSILYYFAKNDSSFTSIFASKEEAEEYIAKFKEYALSDGGSIEYENVTYVMQPQASMTIMDQTTGEVKAIIGGRGEKTGSLTFNRATEATRQPGSTFKIVTTYGPAIDMGKLTLASVIDDTPYHYSYGDTKIVSNYDNKYMGLVDVRFAIADSRNIPAVKALALITPQVGFNYALKFGFTTLVSPENAINGMHDMVESLCLGGLTRGVTNIDLCAAYASIANKGVYNEPTYYTAVYDSDGNVLLDNANQDSHRVIKESTSEILTSALQSVTKIGTGMYTNVSSQPVAGKTGTTNNDVDKWYVGYTPYYTGAIWFGYDDNSKYDGNGILHVRLWGKIMTRVHEGLERGEYTMSDNIIEVEVCAQSGKLPVAGVCDCDPRGSQLVKEYFIKGTEPTETCNVHEKVKICNETGQLATSGCTHITERIYIVKSSSTTLSNELTEEEMKLPVLDWEYELPKGLTNCVKHAPVNTSSGNSGSSSNSSTGSTSGSTNTTDKTDEKATSSTNTTKPTTSH